MGIGLSYLGNEAVIDPKSIENLTELTMFSCWA